MQRIIYILIIAALLAGCRTTKKVTRTENRDSTITHSESVRIGRTVTEKHYGDTLQALVPVTDFSQPVTIESKGIAATVSIETDRDTSGNIIARRMKITAVAKPHKETVTEEKVTGDAGTKIEATVQTTEKADVIRKPFSVFTIIGVIGFLIILYLIFLIIKQIFFKHKN